MRVVELTAYHLRIPLRKTIRHASHTRTDNDTLVVRCKLDDGTVGWGEGLPREYVTGETIDSTFETPTSGHHAARRSRHGRKPLALLIALPSPLSAAMAETVSATRPGVLSSWHFSMPPDARAINRFRLSRI
jgi:L-alanine-DL-glutamate epimerase-like enolase superfamily enzyme